MMVSQSPLTQAELQPDFEILMLNPLPLSGVASHCCTSRLRLQAHPAHSSCITRGRGLVGGFAAVQSRDKVCAGKQPDGSYSAVGWGQGRFPQILPRGCASYLRETVNRISGTQGDREEKLGTKQTRSQSLGAKAGTHSKAGRWQKR